MPILETKNLEHRFPDGTLALKGISLALEEGDFLIITGKNGSGKSVLVRHFNGLLSPTGGEVFYRDKPVGKNLLMVRQRVGMVFQDPDSQIVGQTVWQDTAFGPENLRLPEGEIHKRVENSLRSMGLEHLKDHRPATLSGGEKKKLALAGILAMEPEIIIFDEPFEGLDYPGVVMVLTQITGLHQKGHTIVIITHEVEKSLAHANRLLILDQGRIVRQGTPEEVLPDLESFGVRAKPFTPDRIGEMSWLRV